MIHKVWYINAIKGDSFKWSCWRARNLILQRHLQSWFSLISQKRYECIYCIFLYEIAKFIQNPENKAGGGSERGKICWSLKLPEKLYVYIKKMIIRSTIFTKDYERFHTTLGMNAEKKYILTKQVHPKDNSDYAPCDKPENRIILSLGLPVNVFLSRLVKLFIRLRSTWQKKMPEFDIESRDEGFSEIIFKAAAVFSHMNQRMWGREWEKLSTTYRDPASKN